jgi:hypothetical protein
MLTMRQPSKTFALTRLQGATRDQPMKSSQDSIESSSMLRHHNPFLHRVYEQPLLRSEAVARRKHRSLLLCGPLRPNFVERRLTRHISDTVEKDIIISTLYG